MKKSFFTEFARGVKAYGPAFRMLFSQRFAWFLVFPVVAWLLFLFLGIWLVGVLGGSLSEWLQDILTAWLSDLSWVEKASGVVLFIFRILLKLAYFWLFLSIGGYVVLIVLSPVFSWLSERAEKAWTGQEYKTTFGILMRGTWRGILISLRNTLFQTLVSVVLFFFSFVPVLGLLSPVLLFLSASYFYGFSFVDYTIERRYMQVKTSVRYVNRNIGFVMGIGLPFAAALLLPFGRFIVCGFISLVSVIAATIAVCHEDGKKELP